MKVAVTGGLGFIGTATLSNGKARGHDIWAVDRASGGDILNDLGGLKGADAVIHLAGVLGTGELFQKLEEAVDVNVRGSARVMQWCIDNGASYIDIGMLDVFPSVYTATKVATDRLMDALVRAKYLRAARVRAFNAYGPNQHYGAGHPQKIIPTFSVKAWQRSPIPIWGTGTQSVDLVHVDDVARMLIDAVQLLDKGHQGFTLDAGTGIMLSVNEVAAIVAEATGWECKTVNLYTQIACAEYLPMREGEIESINVVAKGDGWDLLDWRPRFDMDLLRETVHWYRDYA